MKKFSELTEAELANISDVDLYHAVQLEAAHQGLYVPVPVNDFVHVSVSLPERGGRAYYELAFQKPWGGPDLTGLIFTTEEQALNAVNGSLAKRDDGRKVVVVKRFADIEEAEPVQRRPLVTQDAGPFEELYKAARNAVAEAYRTKINREYVARQWVQYLDLAKGDAAIAKSFWAKLQSGPVPTLTDEEMHAHREVLQGARHGD